MPATAALLVCLSGRMLEHLDEVPMDFPEKRRRGDQIEIVRRTDRESLIEDEGLLIRAADSFLRGSNGSEFAVPAKLLETAPVHLSNGARPPVPAEHEQGPPLTAARGDRRQQNARVEDEERGLGTS